MKTYGTIGARASNSVPEHYAPSAEDRAQLRAEGYPLNSIAPEVVRRKLRAHLNELRKDETVHPQDLLDLIEGILYLVLQR